MKPETERVFGLDVMRASAILLVLLGHATVWFASCVPVFNIGCLGGYFGVELFFVLSGFLIGSILLRWLIDPGSTTTLFDFWRRRWLRTLPNYVLFLGVNTVLSIWLYHTTPPVLRYLFFCQNVTDRPPAFFVESWSLAIEEWFYVLVPMALVVAAKISRKSFRTSSFSVICAVIAAVTVARCIYVVITQPMWLTGVRLIVVYRLDACMFGVLAAWVKCFYPAWWHSPSRLLFIVGLLTLVVIGILVFVTPTDSLFLHTAGFPFTSFAAALLLPVLDSWKASHALGSRAIVRISVWSYSLYFVNVPVFALLFERYHGTARLFCATVFLLVSIPLAALVYRFYEKPIMKLRNRAPALRRGVSPRAAVIIAASGELLPEGQLEYTPYRTAIR